MKKLVIAMLLAGVTLGLTACGEKKAETKQPEIQDPVASPVHDIQKPTEPKWVRLGASKTVLTGHYYLDENSIHPDGQYKKVMAKVIPQNQKYSNYHATMEFTLDCSGKIKFGEPVFYENGVETGRASSNPKYTGWTVINAGTPFEKAESLVCK